MVVVIGKKVILQWKLLSPLSKLESESKAHQNLTDDLEGPKFDDLSFGVLSNLIDITLLEDQNLMNFERSKGEIFE